MKNQTQYRSVINVYFKKLTLGDVSLFGDKSGHTEYVVMFPIDISTKM